MTTPSWCFADVWEAVADEAPHGPAVVGSGARLDWAAFDGHADGLAQCLLDQGLGRQASVAQYLHNGPEYLVALFACSKVAMRPVNTNHRYADDELVHLWTDADVAAVVFHGTFTGTVERVRHRLPTVRCWIRVDDGSGACPDWAVPYERASARRAPSTGRCRAPWGRGGDDIFLLYTGGTTGRPKGVMWRQDDLFVALNRSAPRSRRFGEVADLEAVRRAVSTPGIVVLPASPLMHAAGLFTALIALSTGGSVVTLGSPRFDPVELLDTAQEEGVGSIAIVGDAFARPLVDALDDRPGRWELPRLKVITSSGVMWSASVKEALLRHLPHVRLVDTLGSSEAIGAARSVSAPGAASATAAFEVGPDTKVLADDGSEVEPGSGVVGRLAVHGRTPVGYLHDGAATAATFPVIDGRRFSIPGDLATVEADGTIRLLGRGSACINTGGEKVFPEEVEEVLKERPEVRDAIVVGVPDVRFGERVVAVVEPTEPTTALDEGALAAHVRGRLAAYKAPRRVLLVPSLERAANGKVDQSRWRRFAAERA